MSTSIAAPVIAAAGGSLADEEVAGAHFLEAGQAAVEIDAVEFVAQRLPFLPGEEFGERHGVSRSDVHVCPPKYHVSTLGATQERRP